MTRSNQLSPATLRRLSAAFPFEFTNADDAVNGALDKLQALQQQSTAPPASRPPSDPPTTGALYEFIEGGDFDAGDELRWERPNLRETHIAHVDANGCIVTEDGRAHRFPSNAIAHIAPGQRPHPWEAWIHVPSGKPIGTWREEYRHRKHNAPTPGFDEDDAKDWREVIAIVLERLPHGAWTTYGDLSRLTGRHQREIGGFLSRAHELKNAWRVLLAEGKVSPNFTWPGEHRGDPHELLRSDGVRFSRSQVADPAQRMHVDDLRKLLVG
ncbi:restriction system modified-DNA reader domain-containing protein [Glycomyces xiaoerkulensis]|uniref:restriction system modified-DNA reader domain-containing protein n=1 Tax=Glycomyces xiaoerkulensis TaxID=2038139 RepID=UPI000C25C659|nr:MGMT family protein [Glycomyces xiaoerkulensis]